MSYLYHAMHNKKMILKVQFVWELKQYGESDLPLVRPHVHIFANIVDNICFPEAMAESQSVRRIHETRRNCHSEIR